VAGVDGGYKTSLSENPNGPSLAIARGRHAAEMRFADRRELWITEPAR
jgi:hypothetical protein